MDGSASTQREPLPVPGLLRHDQEIGMGTDPSQPDAEGQHVGVSEQQDGAVAEGIENADGLQLFSASPVREGDEQEKEVDQDHRRRRRDDEQAVRVAEGVRQRGIRIGLEDHRHVLLAIAHAVDRLGQTGCPDYCGLPQPPSGQRLFNR